VEYVLALLVIRLIATVVTELINNRSRKVFPENEDQPVRVQHPAEYEMRWE
jgi:hypothetical protein